MISPTDSSSTPTAPASRPSRRRGLQPRAIVAVAVVWILLWDQLSWGNLVNGLLIGLVVTLVFPLPSLEFGGWPRPHRVAWVILCFLGDLVRASVQVIHLVFSRRPFRNAVIEVQLRSRSDLYLTITAELVALVPGSVPVEARRSTSTLYIHLLDAGAPGELGRQRRHVLQIEERVVRAVGSRAEIADLERKKREEQHGGPPDRRRGSA